MTPKSSTACAELNQCMALTHSGHSRTQALITACQSDNLEYGDTSVKCLDCECVTTEAAAAITIGLFELTSPTEMPKFDPIRIRSVSATAPEVAGAEWRDSHLQRV
jgi:hypothetical protein